MLPFKWLTLFCLLSAGNLCAQTYTVDTLMRNGNRSNRINIAYLSDGYQNAELGNYITNATSINNALFAQAPFLQYRQFFNSFALRVPSAQSGAKHPGTATDENTSGGQPVLDPTTAFQSTFDYASIHRLLVPQNNTAIFNALASNLPDYDQAFVVVNSTYYGGSGGILATSSINVSAPEIAIHEIGHSFAALADEYWAGDVYAGEKSNMTQNTNPATVKWKNWLGIRNVGIYPYGTTGNPATWYRPHQNCKMQFLNVPFCAVCSEKFIDRIHQLTNMVDAYTPLTTSFTLANSNAVPFSVTNIITNPSTISVNWYLNGSTSPFATNVNTVNVPFANFINGNNSVRVELVDNTSLSKSYLPAAGYVNSITWTVNKPVALPVRLKAFTGRIQGESALLGWEIDDATDASYFETEKSRDGINFSRLGNIPAQISVHNYSATDNEMFAPVSYYRLRIVERSGIVNYSNIIRLQNPLGKFSYKVYQQPEARRYRLVTQFVEPQNLSFQVTDINGRIIFSKNPGTVVNKKDYEINLSNKPAGVYYLNIIIGTSRYNATLLAK